MDWGASIKSLWWGFYLVLSTEGFATTGSVSVSLFSFLRYRFQKQLVSLSVALKAFEQWWTSRGQTFAFWKTAYFQMSEAKYL